MWHIEFELSACVLDDDTGEEIDLATSLAKVVDTAYLELRRLGGVIEADVHGVLADGLIIFGVTIEDSDRLEAIKAGSDAVRSALHAADAHTPGWPGHAELQRLAERLASCIDESRVVAEQVGKHALV